MEDLLDNVLGVRVSPSLLHFMDTLVGESYKASLVVQNISPQTKTIRIQGPEDPQFTFTVQNPDKPIACGLQITATVEYRPSKKEDIRDRLLVFVDQDVINIPLLGFTPSCYLEVDSEVNFGNIVANSKVIYKEIAITNHGSSPGTFRIKYTGHLPITLDPSSGTVEPKTKQLIQVEICTDKPSLFEEVAKVKLQGSDEVLVKIKGNIVYQVLRLLDVSGKSLDCLHFGSLYFGTSAARQAVIYNDSPETMHWVSVLDDNALGVEMGTDLEQSTDAALQKLDYRRKAENTEAARMISCLPNQGVLLPFQKTNVTIFFSPKQINEDLLYDKFPPQQDYALFIRFEPIGSKDGFLQSLSNRDVNNIENKKQHVELAVTGSGVPVALSFNPGTLYNFKECFIGEQIDVLCSLQNESQCLPVVFSFCKISHFHISPAKGKIEPGHSQDVMLTFSPHQVGTFKVKQVVDVLGPTTEDNLPPIKTKVFHQKTLTFMAVCSPVTKKIVMKINPGITPKISNATGQFLAASKETAMYTGNTSVAALNSSKTHIHNHQKKDDNEELVAFPNDRAASIRPSDSSKKYRTIFTKVERYNYVDPDYAYTDEEEKLRKSHKDYYVNYIQCIREERLKKEKEREFEDVNNPTDIGITPAAGLVSPSPSIVECFNEPQKTKTHSSLNGRILTTRKLAAGESRSLSRENNEGINATPCTATEKEDCSLTLTPQQLHHVVVGPSTIDFGEVCVRSTSVRQLQIINSLHSYIWVQLQIDFDELQQTGPISHIVPPMAKTEVPIVFETNTFGKFKKSVTYNVNGKHSGHILITAKAVPVALELSSNEIVLTPNSNFLSEKGLRSSVRLYNRRNHPAEFNWKPIITEKGIAFSIRPARGTVDAYKDLECEVVWHPGFSSPDNGEFNLCVLHGNTLKLKCTAELGSTNIQFTEQRVLFAEAPLGLTTYKTAILQNTGLNHAYFQVEDVNPLPGMTVTPSQGFVPIGGYATLQIFFTPEAVMKFDTRLDVSVRNTKPLELRIGGFVIPPQIEISVSSFLFPGVYVNSTQVIPFVLQNKSVAHAKVEFDLSKYQDFSMTFKDGSAVENNPLYPLLYIVELEEKESLECSLHFNPKEFPDPGNLPPEARFSLISYHQNVSPPNLQSIYGWDLTRYQSGWLTVVGQGTFIKNNGGTTRDKVAAYDFELPININFTGDLNAGSSMPVTPTSSEKHLVTPRPQIVNVVTPKCRINATVLLPLLSFSTSKLEFDLSSGFLDLGIADDSLCSQEIELTNISKKNVTWKFNLDRAEKKIDDGIFKFSKHSGTLEPGQKSSIAVNFCPSVPGGYFAEIQVILNNNPDSHYTLLHLHGIVRKPRLLFNPPLVILTPVPLDTETQAIVDITALDFSRKSMLKCVCPEVELDSGELARPFSIEFPNGQTVSSAGDRSEKLFCQISFKSSSPISCLVNLLFTDEYNNQFPLQVSAVAENCILTVYPYLAYHRTDQQVILRSAHNGNGEKGYGTGEAILRPCYIPETPSQSTSSSSLGAATSSTYEESISEDENTLSNERLMSGERAGEYGKNKDVFELSLYPEEDTDEWLFFQNVLAAVRTWFSIFGWPSGCNPITIPQSMWSVCKAHMKNSKGKVAKTINLGKQTKTIYDMLLYLSGQMLPGITASQSLPSNPTERVLQLHWQHATFLTFLRNQGASLPYIKPEFLFEPLDYERWLQVQVQVQIKELQNLNKKNMDKQAEIKLLEINSSTFQSLSKRVWMDILLQIYKVLILSRVTQKKRDDDYVSETMPKINSEPLSSNIYSPSERILLTWLNVNYEKMRKTVWKDCQKGEIPPTRWIINFDRDLLDGLVLAAQMASYCPFLISTHFTSMYTNPESPEECLHNCLILVSALRSISLDIDVQATDICDPNPVMMLMLCVYLHEKLPLYLPKKTVMFDGALHEVVSKEVCLKNPSSKPLVYNATIIGRESDNFFLPKGNTMMIAPKNQATLTLEYKSLHLDPAEATLFLVSSSANGINGTTLAFSLQPRITGVVPSGLYKHESPLYELKKIDLAVPIPIKTRGKFRVILVESTSHLSFPENLKEINHLKKEEAHSLLENASTKVIGETYNEEKSINQVYHPSSMCQFFCPVNSIFLKEGSSASLQIYYIPFDLGKRFCTIIFSNEMIGDFIYQIEGTGIYPLPSAITALNSQNILQTSTSTPGHKNAQKSMLFKCHPDEILEENLIIPLVNEARERALALAAQMQMTDLEYKRRKITGTLQSSSVRVAVVTQGMSKIQTKSLFSSSPFSKKLTSIDYDVEISMPECFTVPKNISLSVTGKSRVKGSPTGVVGAIIDTENRGLLPLQFKPSGPGRYPCQILLRSSHDARVYMIECVVNPARPERELEFITPASEAVIQDIPIQNSSKQDWKMQVVLEGDYFYGPPFLFIPAGETAQYSLMFKPISQCLSLGRLLLQNETDGTEHIFSLRGTGRESLALDHIIINCQVRQIAQKVLLVPNYTNNTLTFNVASDISIIGGAQTITVKPGTSAPYTVNVSPWKRGSFQGVISFVADNGEEQHFQHGISTGCTDDERFLVMDTAKTAKNAPYKVWFSLEIKSNPAPPDKSIEVSCSVLGNVCIDIPMSNPTSEVQHFHVLVDGFGLSGEADFTLQARETFPYMLTFSPTRTGVSTGSVIFQSDIFGEFWYGLQLLSEKPSATTLPEVHCELGKWERFCISLKNPTQEIMELETVNNNPEHFLVEVEPKKPLLLPPNTTTDVTVQFYPSALGKGNHKGSIIFKNPQIEEWIFHMSGVGLIPQPMEPASISARVGSLSSIIITFKNPTDEHVLIDVILTDQEQTMHRLSASVLRHSINTEPAFCLPLKQTQGIPLAPKEKLDIPVLFAPDSMKLYEALVVIHMTKANGDCWAQDISDNINTELKSITRTEKGEISGIRWIYPVHGIPEALPSKSAPAVVMCPARSRTEERVEVLLTGAVPGPTRMPTSHGNRPTEKTNTQDEVQVTNGLSTTEEFFYEIGYESDEVKSQLEPSVAIELVRKERDATSGIVTLFFNVIFAPNKSMRHTVTLMVQCATGGVWKFPINLVATKPTVDDVIQIDAVGLNKESIVGFRLSSQTRHPEPFNAYFVPGSDTAFSVLPQAGELLPLGTAGTLITVGFKPTMYSKKHKATLVVQTSAMQWTYEIKGLTPKSTPLTNISPKISSMWVKQPTTGHQRNFIRENLKLTATAVSSPIKGSPLFLKTK